MGPDGHAGETAGFTGTTISCTGAGNPKPRQPNSSNAGLQSYAWLRHLVHCAECQRHGPAWSMGQIFGETCLVRRRKPSSSEFCSKTSCASSPSGPRLGLSITGYQSDGTSWTADRTCCDHEHQVFFVRAYAAPCELQWQWLDQDRRCLTPAPASRSKVSLSSVSSMRALLHVCGKSWAAASLQDHWLHLLAMGAVGKSLELLHWQLGPDGAAGANECRGGSCLALQFCDSPASCILF